MEEAKKESGREINERLDKVKNWLKEPDNAILAAVLVFAIVVRLYFFFSTSGQTLWYDEADYMSTAKYWAHQVPSYMLNVHRPPAFQLLGAWGFMFGLGEMWIKFLLVLLPSIVLVWLVYLLGKEMYNKKVGLIAAFLMSVSWTLLFWNIRFQPDYLSMCFQIASVLFMWRFWKNNSTKNVVWAGIFAGLGFNFKVSGLLIPMAFIAFILIKDRFSAVFNKKYYYFSLAFLLTLAPYLIWSYMQFGTPFSFTAGYSSAVEAAAPFAWHVLNFFYYLSENVLFALFILGVLIGLKFLLYLDVIAKDKTKAFNPDLFGMIVLVIAASFYIFYIRSIEDRWVFLWLPFMFMFAGNALMFIYDFGKKYTKIISIIAVLALLGIGGYMQLSHAKEIIDSKKDSYSQVKEAALWMKENSLPGDKMVSVSYPQTTYYSERNIILLSNYENASSLEEMIARENPRYIEISIFEQHPEYLYGWPTGNNSVPVQVYYADKEKKQPALIIYELKAGEKTQNIMEVLNEAGKNKTIETNNAGANLG